MPYNVDRDLGGDSPENTKFMEKCVESVMKSGKSKSSAIAICKAQMKKHKEDKDSEFTAVDPTVVAEFDMFTAQCIQKLLDSNTSLNYNDAVLLTEAALLSHQSIEETERFLDTTVFRKQ